MQANVGAGEPVRRYGTGERSVHMLCRQGPRGMLSNAGVYTQEPYGTCSRWKVNAAKRCIATAAVSCSVAQGRSSVNPATREGDPCGAEPSVGGERVANETRDKAGAVNQAKGGRTELHCGGEQPCNARVYGM